MVKKKKPKKNQSFHSKVINGNHIRYAHITVDRENLMTVVVQKEKDTLNKYHTIYRRYI